MPYRDAEKQKEAQRASAKRRREKINSTVTQQRRTLRAYIDALKQQPCDDCGGSWPPQVMDFHHVRGPKLFGVANMANQRRTTAEIDAEIAKCVLLCANCHRLRHIRQGDVLEFLS